jgi:hypothetical protein
MASPLRAREFTEGARILPGTVKTAQAATKGRPLKRNADGTLQTAGAGDRVCGWPLSDAAADTNVSYYAPDGQTVIKAKVGTGGATPGKYAVVVADGVTNEPVLGGGNTLVELCGEFLEEGVAGDEVALRIFNLTSVKA